MDLDSRDLERREETNPQVLEFARSLGEHLRRHGGGAPNGRLVTAVSTPR
jgi:hypothetical protein